MQREVRNKSEVLLGFVDPLCMSDGKESANDKVSRSTNSVEMTEKRDENRVMDACSDYPIDTPFQRKSNRERL